MTFTASTRRFLSIMLTALFLLTTVTSVHAQASMIGTHEVINQEQANVDREALKGMLGDEAVQEKIASMGVSPDQVEQRINSLTADELAYFNAQLDEAPAGAAGGIHQRFGPGILIQQHSMPTGVQQPPVILLPVQFHQNIRQRP